MLSRLLDKYRGKIIGPTLSLLDQLQDPKVAALIETSFWQNLFLMNLKNPKRYFPNLSEKHPQAVLHDLHQTVLELEKRLHHLEMGLDQPIQHPQSEHREVAAVTYSGELSLRSS